MSPRVKLQFGIVPSNLSSDTIDTTRVRLYMILDSIAMEIGWREFKDIIASAIY